MNQNQKYADQFMDWLLEDGYTHCFFVGGGNVMHLLEAASRRFKCVAVVHEVTAGIAVDYFNETAKGKERAFALVTAGPGLTNIVTAIGGAWLESRELLVIGGQAKVSDLAHGRVRQIGHQEIDGVGISKRITVFSTLADRRLEKYEVMQATRRSRSGRKGPVFIEMCIDVSAMPPLPESNRALPSIPKPPAPNELDINALTDLIKVSKRPVVLIGGGVDREFGIQSIKKLKQLGIPLATTWNGFDRVNYDYEYYCGRPNTYGMRWSNILIQQSDLLIAVGTRLGVQQVGFAHELFAPVGNVVQVDIDQNELEKGFPHIDLPIIADGNEFLPLLAEIFENKKIDISEWLEFIKEIKSTFEGPDKANIAQGNKIELHDFIWNLSSILDKNDLIASCSSGGSFNAVMQVFKNKEGQVTISSKGSASMGYGLAGAIGMSFADRKRRTILIEGDGGFAQNMQDLGTVAVNKLNVKIFLASNQGYASIRTTQKSYFNGNYVGCDSSTGLGLPNWEKIFEAFSIPSKVLNLENLNFVELTKELENEGPQAFILDLDPEQLYFPKLTSKVLPDGRMQTNPLHLMSPAIPDDQVSSTFKYLPSNLHH